MVANSSLILWLILWMAASAITLALHWRRSSGGVGLVAAYLVNVLLIHWLGALIYLSSLPHHFDKDLVFEGFKQSTYGVLAFAIGSLILAPGLIRRRSYQREDIDPIIRKRLPYAYLAIGALSYLILSSSTGRIPSITALASAGQNLFVVGLCILCWTAWHEGNKKNIFKWLALGFTMPFITVAFRGFIGYGAAALIVVLTFISTLVRPRWVTIVVAVATAFVGVSIFVSYAQVRDQIRQELERGTPWQDRLSLVYDSTLGLEWFDFNNPLHLEKIDNRLNQNFFVGAARQRLSVTQDFGRGETIGQAALALIPRAVWPDKPVVAGSGDLVTKYTGITFAGDTSVGIGHVLEFYANFGSIGVITGYMLLGTILTLIDVLAAKKLRTGHWTAAAATFMVGLGFLQVGGSLVELTSTSAAGLLLVVVINRHFLHRVRISKLSAATIPSLGGDLPPPGGSRPASPDAT